VTVQAKDGIESTSTLHSVAKTMIYWSSKFCSLLSKVSLNCCMLPGILSFLLICLCMGFGSSQYSGLRKMFSLLMLSLLICMDAGERYVENCRQSDF
jgi:hypothetical protein